MMHMLLRWPEAYDPALWPFALEQAVLLWNHIPKQNTRLSPIELFTGVTFPDHNVIQRARVWGCPTWVLDPRLADGKSVPKWTKRSRLGVYLGCSAHHSTTVGRILNMTTGSISPQYHVVYDELFTTVQGKITDGLFDAQGRQA